MTAMRNAIDEIKDIIVPQVGFTNKVQVDKPTDKNTREGNYKRKLFDLAVNIVKGFEETNLPPSKYITSEKLDLYLKEFNDILSDDADRKEFKELLSKIINVVEVEKKQSA